MNRLLSIIFLALISFCGFAQQGSTHFGLLYRPIVPNQLIGTYEQEFNNPPFFSSVKQKFGNNLGMVIRHGITDRIGIESGINFTQRNFDLNFSVPDSSYTGTNDVRVVSYEVPLMGMFFIRLGEQVYMNTSLGAAMTLFPSDVRTTTEIPVKGEVFLQEGAYRSKVQGAVLANVGVEYRTKRKGYWYLGASYHQPFSPIITFAMSYEYPSGDYLAIDNILGSYLTVDLRYYFNESKDKD